MEFKKKGGRRKVAEFKWKDEKIEEVKEAMYLGYKLQSDNGDGKHIKYITGKANAVVEKVWSIGERKLKNDWKKRMRLFDALVRSVMCYGTEVWGWKEWKELERIQDKYIKWVLKLERTTPGHILHEETRRHKIALTTGKCATKFERKLVETEMGSIGRECWDIIKKKGDKTEREVMRRKYFKNKGWSRLEVERRLEEGEEIWWELMQTGIYTERQENRAHLEQSRYAKEVKRIITDKVPEYLRNNRRNKKGELEMTARFRLGGENRSSRYWMKEEERTYRLCRMEEETLEHIFERCIHTKQEGRKWEEKLDGNTKNLATLHQIKWKRKRIEAPERERLQENTEQE